MSGGPCLLQLPAQDKFKTYGHKKTKTTKLTPAEEGCCVWGAGEGGGGHRLPLFLTKKKK